MIRERQFESIVKAHSDGIHRLSLSLLKHRADAEDATQEVLIKIWQQLPRLNLLNQRAWVYRIARNHCLDKLRSSKAGMAGKLDHIEAAPELIDPCEGEGRAAEVDQATVMQSVHHALEQLPELLRSVFLLYEVNELPHREIAKVLGIPPNSSKVYLHRARSSLKTILNRNEPWIQNYVNS